MKSDASSSSSDEKPKEVYKRKVFSRANQQVEPPVEDKFIFDFAAKCITVIPTLPSSPISQFLPSSSSSLPNQSNESAIESAQTSQGIPLTFPFFYPNVSEALFAHSFSPSFPPPLILYLFLFIHSHLGMFPCCSRCEHSHTSMCQQLATTR